MLQCLENKDYNPKTAEAVTQMTELPKSYLTMYPRGKHTMIRGRQYNQRYSPYMRGGSNKKTIKTQAPTTVSGNSSLRTTQERERMAIEEKFHMAGRELLQQKSGEVVFGDFPYQTQQLLRFNSKMWRNLLYACYDLIHTPKKDKEDAYKVFIYFFFQVRFIC